MKGNKDSFSEFIKSYLQSRYKVIADKVFSQSALLKYLEKKTKSANSGSKSRSSFANIYAIYVLVEDYINKGGIDGNYKNYDGAKFSDLLLRLHTLPFGEKMQNHALNNRLNEEFHKYFPLPNELPIIRDVKTTRYRINEDLLIIKIEGESINIAEDIILIIKEYIKWKFNDLQVFLKKCEDLKNAVKDEEQLPVIDFIKEIMAPSADARLFEIASFCILKYFYCGQNILCGTSSDELKAEPLRLYKTGRTNANDGGIDFVMRPIGRFFQVTETLDFKKYFLDIEKIEHYPISFVIKTEKTPEAIKTMLRDNALKDIGKPEAINDYMACIEEIINIPILLERFNIAVKNGFLSAILDELVEQSKVEYNLNSQFTI